MININKRHSLFNSTNYLIKSLNIYKVFKRTMISSRCYQAARAAYYIASTISKQGCLDNRNTQPFISKVVTNTIDNNQGISQHKTTIWKHMSHQRLPGEHFYEPFIEQVPIATQIVKYEPHALADFRTINELPVLQEYLQTFHKDIVWTYSTLDSRSANFPKAQQTNPDFWTLIDKGMGLRNARCTYQDEKSGMDMFRHSTRGSVGILYFDETGQNIQMTSKPITIHDLIANHKSNLYKLNEALKDDGLIIDSKNTFVKATKIVNDMEGKSFPEFQVLHNKLQNLLWDQLQCNPNYNRSVSFIFIKQIINTPMTEKEYTFSQAFQSQLKDNYLYDLDKKGDLREVYHAWIYAGNKIDPYFVDKLYHLHNNGITLTTDILLILKQITKNAVH